MSNLPYQKHSETSREAAESNTTAEDYRNKILHMIRWEGEKGMTNDEISARFGKTDSYFSPRLIELERNMGVIYKTRMRRKTRSGKAANVYVAKEHYADHMGKFKPKKAMDEETIVSKIGHWAYTRGIECTQSDIKQLAKEIMEAE